MSDFMATWLQTGAVPNWMTEYSRRDISLMMFAVQHADEFHQISPHHPLAVHCLEMKAMVEEMNAFEERDDDERTKDNALNH